MPSFVEEVARVNAIGDAAPGFIWRFTDGEEDNGLSVYPEISAARLYEEGKRPVCMITNLTTWATLEDLRRFTYEGGHLEALRRRREWFEYVPNSNVLWWVDAGERPTIRDGENRLATLHEYGPTMYAFTFKHPF